jgi:hypothetical protein
MVAPTPDAAVLTLYGIEPDNLLAILATLGLLRALDATRPEWHSRVSWVGPPWVPRLHVAAVTDEDGVSSAAAEGVASVAAHLDVDGRKNVDFERSEYRDWVRSKAEDPVTLALAAALSAEWPEKKTGGLRAAPLVMMFGQGHQNFLERLVAVSRSDHASSSKDLATLHGPAKIKEALFARWERRDATNSFRWDPEEDQRYALRFGDPGKAGAALTVHGANRLATLGLLSFVCAPTGTTRLAASGWTGKEFVWPIWTSALTLRAIEALLTHPDVCCVERTAHAVDLVDQHETRPRGVRLRALGVAEVFGAARVPNGKFMNVVRARPLV